MSSLDIDLDSLTAGRAGLIDAATRSRNTPFGGESNACWELMYFEERGRSGTSDMKTGNVKIPPKREQTLGSLRQMRDRNLQLS